MNKPVGPSEQRAESTAPLTLVPQPAPARARWRRPWVAGAEDAEGEHQYGADNRHAGAVNFPARKFADGEHQVAGEKNQVK